MNKTKIDAAPLAIAATMAGGTFHTHQDGKWRFSPFGGETVYVNDPTASFDANKSFGPLRAAASREAMLFAINYSDGTSGLYRWPETWPIVWQVYGPRGEHEAAMRDWIKEFFA